MVAERTNSTFALLTSGVAFVNSLSMMSLTPIFDLCMYVYMCVSSDFCVNFSRDFFFLQTLQKKNRVFLLYTRVSHVQIHKKTMTNSEALATATTRRASPSGDDGAAVATTSSSSPSSFSSSFAETLSTDFISPTELESIAKTQLSIVQKLQNASGKLDEFTRKSKENAKDSMEKLADADESLRNIAEDLRFTHQVCVRVKKGLSTTTTTSVNVKERER